jgi:sensor histidine kinase regulating citrate/malate metabolism
MLLRDWPIRQKLTAMLVLISGLVLLLTSAAFAGYQYWSLRRSTRDALSVRARIIAANSTASLAFSNDADAREILSALRADPHMVAAVLYDKSGHHMRQTRPAVPSRQRPGRTGTASSEAF